VGRLWRDLTVDHGFLRSTAVRPDPELPPPDPSPAGSGGQFPLFPALPAARMGHGCCTAGAPPPLHWRRGWLLPSPALHAAFIPSPARWPLPSLALRTLGLEDPGSCIQPRRDAVAQSSRAPRLAWLRRRQHDPWSRAQPSRPPLHPPLQIGGRRHHGGCSSQIHLCPPQLTMQQRRVQWIHKLLHHSAMHTICLAKCFINLFILLVHRPLGWRRSR